MASDPRPIDYIGYGAIYALHSILATNLELLTSEIIGEGRVATRPYLIVAEGMITAMHLLRVTPVWSDARTQFLLLTFCYRDLVESLTRDDPEVFRQAAAALSQAQMMAAASLQQLAVQLDVLPEQERAVGE
jgi:uncharacterized membrane protein